MCRVRRTDRHLSYVSRPRLGQGIWDAENIRRSQADAGSPQRFAHCGSAAMNLGHSHNVDKLPLGLVARGEYEDVARKPLGDGLDAVPVRQFADRDSALPCREVRRGMNVFISSGYGGQTLETRALPRECDSLEQIT